MGDHPHMSAKEEPVKIWVHARRLGLPVHPLGNGSANYPYWKLCEVLSERRRCEAGEMAQLSNGLLSKHSEFLRAARKALGATTPPPADSLFEGEVDDWVAWLRSLPALQPANHRVLNYLHAVALRVDHEQIDTCEPLCRISWDELRRGLLDKPIKDAPSAIEVVLAQPAGDRRRSWLSFPADLDGQRMVNARVPVRVFADSWTDAQGEPLLAVDDKAMAALVRFDPEGDWHTGMQGLEAAFKAVFGEPWHAVVQALPAGARLLEPYLIDASQLEPSGLVDAYERLRQRPIRGLLKSLLDGREPDVFPVLNHEGLLGHMDSAGNGDERIGFALDPSQRRAAAMASRLPAGHAMGVINGPPGTGKTSVLRAVIASHWVQDAVNDRVVPRRVWATGATNQSVRNVIGAFDSVAGPEGGTGIQSRWLPGLPSYGWMLPAKSRVEDSSHLMTLMYERKVGWVPGGIASDFLGVWTDGVEAATAHYLERAKAWGTSLEAVTAALLRRLKHLCTEIDTATAQYRRVAYQLRGQPILKDPISQPRVLAARKALLDARERLANDRQRYHDLVDAGRQAQSLAPGCEPDWRARLPRWLQIGPLRPADWRQRPAWRELLALAEQWLPATTADTPAGIQAQMRTLTAEAVVAIRQAEEQVEKDRYTADQLAGLREERRQAVLALHRACGGEGMPSRSEARVYRRLDEYADSWEPAFLLLQARLDRRYRFEAFHLAARYWEGRYLERWAFVDEKYGRTPSYLDDLFMLAPVCVATASRLQGLLLNGTVDIDVMIFDEAGQCPVLDALPLLASTHHALCVGDMAQIEPVYPLADEDSLELAHLAGLAQDELPAALSAHAGSAMALAQRCASLSEPDAREPGVTLRYHYRCHPDIIGYCNALSYGGVIVPMRPADDADAPEYRRHMSWVSVPPAASKVDSSWRHRGEAEEMARWLAHDQAALCQQYGQPLDRVVALLAPFRAQVATIREALRQHLAGIVDAEVIERMTVGTVHALQGDERPVVAFSLTQDRSAPSLFADRDGGHLMNVAVSRAKDAFIVFGDPKVLGVDQYPAARGRAPVAQLGRYLRAHGSRRYPNRLVVIEAPGKVAAVREALGLDAVVVATGGYVQPLVRANATEGLVWGPFDEDVAKDLAQWVSLSELIVATDDDLAGELIGWQVAQQWRAAGARGAIRRVRYHSIERADVELAFRTPGDRFDAGMLRAALARAVMHQAEIERERRVLGGRGEGLARRAILEWVDRAEREAKPTVQLRIERGDKAWTGFVATGSGTAAPPLRFEDPAEADAVAASLPIGQLMPWRPLQPMTQVPDLYPGNSTLRVLALAAGELDLWPWEAQDILNQLYLEGARRD